MKQQQKPKICLISSKGGHFYQLYQLKKVWQQYDHFWITEQGPDTNAMLKKERVYYGYFPVTRHGIHAIMNFFLGCILFFKERPTILLSCGSGIAPPLFLAGKLFGCTLFFIDSYTFLTYPSMSARIVARLGAMTYTQHTSLAQKKNQLHYMGSIL